MTVAMPEVRSVFWAARVDGVGTPWDTIHLRVFYPAAGVGDLAEKMTGIIAADAARAPYPLVILMPGINVGPDSYRWLATHLAGEGYAVVTYAWVTPIMPGQLGINPGIDLDVLTPDTYLTGPSATALPALLNAVRAVGEQPPLTGLLDTSRVAVGGHSAGGTVAIQAANPEFFPQVAAAFAYGGHNMASTLLGWPAGSVLPLPSERPLLLLAGTEDGVIAASAVRYGEEAQSDRVDPIERTFEQAVTSDRGDSYYVVIDGANHFTVAHPLDPTSARSFLDHPARGDEDEHRTVLAEIVTLFLDAHLRGDDVARKDLDQLVDAPPATLAVARRK
jgi:dienelactone hydrolase